MAIPSHLTAKTEGIVAEKLLSDWQWLVHEKFTPVLMTAFGDLFLRNEAGQIYFLDLMCGEFNQIAVSQGEFESLCDDREQRRKWFAGNLVMELRKLHGELDANKCFSCKIPLSLGGQLETSNFVP